MNYRGLTVLVLIILFLEFSIFNEQAFALARRYQRRTNIVEHNPQNRARVNAHSTSKKKKKSSQAAQPAIPAKGKFDEFFDFYLAGKRHLNPEERQKLEGVLVRGRSEIDTPNRLGVTLLMYASYYGDVDTLDLIIRSGAKVDALGFHQRTALLAAVMGNQIGSLLRLKDAGANVYHTDENGDSALIYAVGSRKSCQLILHLLAWGVDTDHKNDRGQTVFDYLEKNEKAKVLLSAWQSAKRSQTLDEFLYAKSLLMGEYPEDEVFPVQANQYLYDLGRKRFYFSKFREFRRTLAPITPSVGGEEFVLPSQLPEAEMSSSCVICYDQKGEGQDEMGSGPAGCTCYLCPTCKKRYIEFEIENCSESKFSCPGCDGGVILDFFQRAGCNDQGVMKIAQVYVDKQLSETPGWLFCKTANCSGGRIVENEGSAVYYVCSLCEFQGCLKCGEDHLGECTQAKEESQASREQMEFLLREGREAPIEGRDQLTAEDPLYYKGRFRPCYYCGLITERVSGCNSIQCLQPKCKKSWHWNYGDHAMHPHNIPPRAHGLTIVHDRECRERAYFPLRPAHF